VQPPEAVDPSEDARPTPVGRDREGLRKIRPASPEVNEREFLMQTASQKDDLRSGAAGELYSTLQKAPDLLSFVRSRDIIGNIGSGTEPSPSRERMRELDAVIDRRAPSY
jgi:hypothetical protein